jgi:hypothetical protein
MIRDLFWEPLEGRGFEHVKIDFATDRAAADGVILFASDDSQFRFQYQIECDANWRVRRVACSVETPSQARLTLTTDGDGNWFDDRNFRLERLNGCVDIDISATPFTNTIPIKRLRLGPGRSADVAVAYLKVPEMRLEPGKQRYTCLRVLNGGSVHRFEHLSNHFAADLEIDSDGLVLDYPQMFQRVWPRQVRR